METYSISLPLSGCLDDLLKMQERLKQYDGQEVEYLHLGQPRRSKLINLHIGTVNSYYIGLVRLAVNFHSQGYQYIKEFGKVDVTFTDDNRIICKGSDRKYEYQFFKE